MMLGGPFLGQNGDTTGKDKGKAGGSDGGSPSHVTGPGLVETKPFHWREKGNRLKKKKTEKWGKSKKPSRAGTSFKTTVGT